MPSINWPNPVSGQVSPYKRFCIQMDSRVGAPVVLLDRAAGALKGINAGLLWRVEPDLRARADIPTPDTYELSARATYRDGREAHLVLELVAQPHKSQPAVGLFFTYGHLPSNMLPPWSSSDAESLVAISTLHILDTLRAAIGMPRPPNENPIGRLQWHEPSSGWFTHAPVFYGGWNIELGR